MKNAFFYFNVFIFVCLIASIGVVSDKNKVLINYDRIIGFQPLIDSAKKYMYLYKKPILIGRIY